MVSVSTFSLIILIGFSSQLFAQNLIFKAGHPSLQHWLLPDISESFSNKREQALIKLGKQLFFDPRISSSGKVTCVSCHLPEKGWEDGWRTSVRHGGKITKKHTQTLVNVAYGDSFTWDGHVKSLEDEAYGAQGVKAPLNAVPKRTHKQVITDLYKINDYKKQFKALFPEKGITRRTIAKAIAAFERTILSDNSPFDQWVKGDKFALTKNQIKGFEVFVNKAKCNKCHHAPNFTDEGFHNIGLKSFSDSDHLKGRKKVVPLKMLDGAFKTPTLRDIALRDPYFHDGSAATLKHVVKHYLGGDLVKTNLSPNFNQGIVLTVEEENQIIEFMEALTTLHQPFIYPILPENAE